MSSPRREPKRPALVACRISADGKAAILARAEAEDTHQSDLLRRLLKYGMTNMPKGYR